MGQEEAYKLIDETEEIFNKFGMDAEVYPKSSEAPTITTSNFSITPLNLICILKQHYSLYNIIKNYQTKFPL